jgi:hypothetical protein
LIYFAYGSNMSTPRLRERVPSATPLGAAQVRGWKLRFNKRSVDGSGKCTLEQNGGELVHGVLFEIDAGERLALDRAEGPGYSNRELLVASNGSKLSSFSYVAKENWLDGAIRPYTWYIDLVVAGAREHGLPETYVGEILAVEVVPDPDPLRAARNRELL